ncbi:hypothetical protein F4821DRAFT_59255 [Hypoxylon rubiginosum]|uniref:Uncharacterized protein n=1 Tax=Hypoxylon rubiginosum TaxID=110542 RepID=A0ACC0CJ91_9PEZI|nr:hypothetical protein F4821DRAFT_59255 [Hypoxylon rubiginosum]
MDVGLEIPVFGASAASRVVQLGASRIELNAAGSYPAGGLTPSLEDLRRIASINVPIRIMIRPRGPLPQSSARDFVYSDQEFEEMEVAIQSFKRTGWLNKERGDGFVFGILKEDPPTSKESSAQLRRCWVDKERCSRLVTAAQPFKTVFHRAFDEIVSCDDEGQDISERDAWKIGLSDLAICGFDAILTSGGLGNAIQNVALLESIVTRAEGFNIEIIAGGGIRRHNVKEISQHLKLKERKISGFVHSACLSSVGSEDIDVEEVEAILSQLDRHHLILSITAV